MIFRPDSRESLALGGPAVGDSVRPAAMEACGCAASSATTCWAAVKWTEPTAQARHRAPSNNAPLNPAPVGSLTIGRPVPSLAAGYKS